MPATKILRVRSGEMLCLTDHGSLWPNYDDLDRAHTWLMKQYEEYHTAERAAVIYDQQENRRRVPCHRPQFCTRGKRLSLRHS
jgi:hypothetical protein